MKILRHPCFYVYYFYECTDKTFLAHMTMHTTQNVHQLFQWHYYSEHIYIYILFYIRWQLCGGFVKDVILKPFKRKLKCCIIEYINIYCNALCSVIEMFTNEHLDNGAKVRITLRNTETYSSSVCTHLSSSMTWLPINQTKLLKYGTAVLSRI